MFPRTGWVMLDYKQLPNLHTFVAAWAKSNVMDFPPGHRPLCGALTAQGY
jgi:hypothetical protein